MKKFNFKNVLDGFRSSVNTSGSQPGTGAGGGSAGAGGPSGLDRSCPVNEIVETLKPEHFVVSKTFCHGFPYQPTAIAFDPVQKLIAIGTQCGSLRILGRPGVDIHEEPLSPTGAVIHLEFLVNEGKLVSATADDVLHLWNFRENKKPEIIHSLKFQRERITVIRIPLQSRWVYIGTERGNIHVVNLDSFQLSGYIINWNKAIELSRKTHPGSVVYLGDNPTDPSKLLIAYDSGQIVLWDLRLKMAEVRYQGTEPLRSVAWHSDGKMFVSSHSDGSMLTWNMRVVKPINVSFPHARGTTKDGKPETFRPILKVDWKSSRSGDNFVIFSGGLAHASAGENNYGGTPSLTVIHGKTTTVLEMEHNVLDFIVICESQWESEIQDPTGIIVLLQSDLVIIDLLTPGYPCYPNPYPMDIHESPVTTCVYIANCPGDLIPALYSVGSKGNKKTGGYSDREWPVNGGTWGTSSCSYAEIVITGHADGSVKFWDGSSTSLQVLYKLKTSKAFERQSSKKTDDSDPYAVQLIKICTESRLLLVAGASSQVLLFKYRKSETSGEIPVLEIPIVNELVEDEFGGFDYSMRVDRDKLEFFSPLRIKSGPFKKSPGYQIELVCLTPWVNGEPPGGICSLALSSGNGLLGYGTETGVVIVDYIQQVCLLSNATPDLYGTADPYTRAPKSPSSLKRDESPPDSQQSFDICASTPSGETGDTSTTPSAIPPALPHPAHSQTNATPSEDTLSLPPSSTAPQPAKSPRSSWANVKSLLTGKGKVKKATLVGASVGGATSGPASASGSLDTGVSGEASKQSSTAELNNGGASGLTTEPEFLLTNFHSQIASNSSDTTTSSPNELPNYPPEIKSVTFSKSQPAPPHLDSSSSSWGGRGSSSDNNLLEKPDAAGFDPETDPEQSHLIIVTEENDEEYVPSDEDSSSTTTGPFSIVRPKDLPLHQSDQGKGGGVAGGGPPSAGSSSLPPVAPPRQRRPKKSKVIDLRCTNSNSLMTSVIRKIHKLDSTFSRSRSSSMSSLDNITSESIQCLTFVETFPKKNDPSFTIPTVWVGTSLGSILVLNIGSAGSNRQTDALTITPSGTIFRLKGAILEMTFMDATGSLISGSTDSWRDDAAKAKTPTKTSSRGSPTDPGLSYALHYAILVSEKQSRVVSLPSQTCLYKAQLVNNNNPGVAGAEPGMSSAPSSSTTSYFVIKAGVTTIKDSPCLVTYNSNGHLSIYSLPSLRILIDVDFVPLSDLSFLLSQSSSGVLGASGSGGARKSGLLVDPMLSIWGQQIIIGEDTNLIAKTFCISEYGHGLYLSSPSEMQKFTISSDFSLIVESMLGSLFIETEFPEKPKEGFFTGLFGAGPKNLDREELFGEASGKAPRNVAKLLTGPNPSPQMEHLAMRASTVGGEVARARMLLVERGERLGQLEDKTAKMMNDAENFSSAAHQLMLKYKDKKWYQL